jgi:hypothetical protein
MLRLPVSLKPQRDSAGYQSQEHLPPPTDDLASKAESLGIFEIVAADEAEVVGRKRKPACADIDCLPSLALRHPCCPIYPRHPYLPRGRRGQGAMVNQGVGPLATSPTRFQRARVFADQFQRNGVILDRRLWRSGLATLLLSVEERRSSGLYYHL